MDMLPSAPTRCGEEDSSIEESVLLGLEAVLSQVRQFKPARSPRI